MFVRDGDKGGVGGGGGGGDESVKARLCEGVNPADQDAANRRQHNKTLY